MCTHYKPRSSTFSEDFEKNKYNMPFIFILFAILIKTRLQNVKLSKFRLFFNSLNMGMGAKNVTKLKGFNSLPLLYNLIMENPDKSHFRPLSTKIAYPLDC